MYYKFFGLDQPPFKITPDTRLFFPGANRGAALEALVYAITNGEGIVKVVGEVGSGKTMLCRMLELELPDHVEVVYIANPSLSPEHILHAIAFELKLDVKPGDDRLVVMRALQDFLLAKHTENRRVVLFIEEAQSMPMATLEEVRLLSNLETGQDKLMQIVLFGQPELEDTLSRHEIRQLKERITHTFPLTPFQRWEIRDYLNSRLRACGFRGGEVFGPSAVKEIESYSAGLVRRINIIADKSMLAAYAEQAMAITPKHVRMAAKDSEYRPQRRFPAWAGTAAAGILLLAVAGTLYWLYAGRGDTTGPTEAATGSPPAAASPTTGSEVAGSAQAREAAPEDGATASAGAPVAASSGQNAPQTGTSRADQASGMASSESASRPATSP
jgi:type II secretory pathway predicted ATPase ExeA